MGNALVTVITPAYNVGKWIGEAIDSVLAQTERRFEYIVVDDGSTDDTAEVVRARTAADHRLRLITTANNGSSAARNVGLAEARTPYVAFLDGDDRWHPRFLSSQLSTLAGAPVQVGAVYCHSRIMRETGQVVMLRLQPSGRTDLDTLLVQNNPPHNGSSLLLRRSCFTELGSFDTALPSAVDFEMWLRIAAHSSTPVFWGNRRYLVDMRLMRPGCISADRAARFEALDKVLAEYVPLMNRLHHGLAYVRPAVFAYRDGFDDIGDRWAREALQAGALQLARSTWGTALLTWERAGSKGRAGLRAARDHGRAGVYKGMTSAMRLANSRG